MHGAMAFHGGEVLHEVLLNTFVPPPLPGSKIDNQSNHHLVPTGIPIAYAVLRPRCWSGMKRTRLPRANADSKAAHAFDEVHTRPAIVSPQTRFDHGAVELM